MRGKDGDTVYNRNTLLWMDYGVLSVNLNLFKSGNTKCNKHKRFCFVLICIKTKGKQGVISPYYEKYKKIINNKLTSNLSSNPCVGFNHSARDKNYYL